MSKHAEPQPAETVSALLRNDVVHHADVVALRIPTTGFHHHFLGGKRIHKVTCTSGIQRTAYVHSVVSRDVTSLAMIRTVERAGRLVHAGDPVSSYPAWRRRNARRERHDCGIHL